MLCVALPAAQASASPLDAIASFFGFGAAEPAADSVATAVAGTSVVDGSSHADWSGVVDSTTENIGRIWTDKSVYNEDVQLPGVDDQTAGPTIKRDGSDFLVGLSALSSMSNTTITTSAPLDIVLVLDTSGSMDDPGRAVYADSLDKTKTYYERGIFGYREITWNESEQSWGYRSILGRWNSVTPKTSESDWSGTQLYLNGSKLSDLKVAARDFVEKTREANASIEGQENKHRIALVTFSSGADLRSGLVVVDNDQANELNSLLNRLDANGATEADNGFATAQSELENAREGAQKAVIFFTDGDPGQSGFDAETANRAVSTALSMKKAKTLVFSVGTFDGADPGDLTTNSNQFMNAVSSNYPEATEYNNLGNRVDGKDYYFAQNESQSLGEIFNTIFDEVTSGTGSPTEIETGHPSDESGYITFTDKLGAYMQVDNFKSVLFADQLFENPTEKTEGNTTTYTFNGTVADSDLYPNAEMSDLHIKVQRSDNVAEGDTVTVEIPASLIPLRKFQVYPEGNSDGKTSTVTNTWPMRIYFGVSPKPEVAGLLANPDEAMLKYIASNRNAGTGTVSFYTNDYAKSDPGKTIANFTPAENNSYYYFTEDTPIYTKEDCSVRVTGALDANETYWYQREYYSIEGGKSVVKTAKYSFSGDSAIALSGAVAYDASGAYLKKGSPRVTHIDELHKKKVDNVTGTGTDVINPTWNHEDSVDAATQINVRLGNNGRFDAELPGALAVSKTVEVPAGYASDAFDNTDFTFNIELTDAQGSPVTGTYAAAIKDAKDAVTQIKNGITFDAKGEASQAIKPGETLYVYGLAEGVEYVIAEKPVKGFSVDPNEANGSIAAGEIVAVSFKNTYTPDPVDLNDGQIKAQKNLTGRKWQEGDSFEIRLRAEGDAPMPEGSVTEDNIRYKSVTVTNGSAGTDSEKEPVTFGGIEYTAPGEYQYTIHEEAPTNRIPGVTYTDAIYRVWVTVEDADLDGSLDAPKVVMKQTYDDNGDAIGSPSETPDGVAIFTNKYSVQEIDAAPQGVKTLTGTTQQLGKDPFKFEFKVTTMQDGTPVPTSAEASGRLNRGDSFTVGHAENGNITFGLAKFDSRDRNKTYVYQVEEVIPADALDSTGKRYADATEDERKGGTWKLNGVTYDSTVWLASVTLGEKAIGGESVLDPIWTYEGSGSAGASTASQIVFNNTYAAEPVTLADDNLIKGSKSLEGRDFKENESFGFTIQPHDPATEAAIDDGSIAGLDGLTAPVKVDGRTPGGAFDFGKATFSKAGTYRFDVYESHWNDAPIQGDMQDKKGMTFDSGMYVVTVTVTDNTTTGKLEAKTTYVKGGNAADKADFVNTYSTSGSFGDIAGSGIAVGKTLSGRDMVAGEFDFTIKALNGVDNAVEAEKKLAALGETSRSFSNQAYAEGRKWTTEKLDGLAFTNEDAGKTFSYVIDEVEPAADKAKPGVTYDKSEFRLDLTVSDDGDGNLSVATDIKLVKNADGSVVDEPATEIAFANTYKPESITVDFSADAHPQLYKRLNGRDWKNGDDADEFMFQVTATNGAPTPVDTASPYEVKLSGKGQGFKNGDNVPFNIGAIEFDQAGTYSYEVKEQKGTIPGIKYDSDNTAIVTARVVDNTATGELEVAEVQVSSGTFTNEYSAQADYADLVNFKLTKQLTGGKKMSANQFSFTVTAKDKLSADKFSGELVAGTPEEFTGPSQAAIDAAGDGDPVDMPSAVHTPLIFTTVDSGKTFTYTFAEKDAGQTGYTYDKTSYKLAVTPRDNGDGTMDITSVVTTFEDGKQQGEPQTYEAKAGQTDDQKPDVILPFVNAYKAVAFDGVPVDLTFTKILKGKSWKGDTFEFVMTGIDGTNTSDFSAKAMVNRSNGTVTDADGAHEMAPISFGKLTYTEPGTYKYEVREVIPDEAVEAPQGVWTLHGVQYDTHKATVEVEVTDVNGALAATANVTDGTFTNVYKAQINYGKAGGLAITKTLNGRNMLAGQFSFTVDPGDDASAKLIGLDAGDKTLKLTSPKANAGAAGLVGNVFDAVTFTQDNVGETYTYAISEDTADNLGAGYTCTGGKSFTVAITVADAGDGKLKVTTTVTNDKSDVAEYVYETGVTPEKKASVDFVNEYTASPVVLGGDGQVKINATKTLSGRDMIAGEFGFSVYNVTNGNEIELAKGGNAAAKDDVAGDVTFEAIGFTSIKLAQDLNEGKANAEIDSQTGAITYTYDYRVDETRGFGGDTGVSQGAKSFNVTVKVVDDNKGDLAASVDYPAGSNDVLGFTNFYGENAKDDVQVNGVKQYNAPQGGDYKVPSIDGKFSFTLEGENGAPMPAGSADGKLTVKNVAGNVDFGVISYTMENVWGSSAATADANGEDGIDTTASAPREKTFTYTVTESGSVDGVTNDPSSVREFSVTVTDDGRGNITAKPSFGSERAFTFTNSYMVNPGEGSLTGNGGFKITKQLKGRDLVEGEFEFTLTDATGTVVASAKNAADGTVTMPGMTFDKPGVYKYTLAEVKGSAGGVTYDPTTYDVVATVTHDSESAGALTVQWAVDGHKSGDELTFANTYEATPKSIMIRAAKVLKGRDLKAGEFEFVLSESGKKLRTAKNDADGGVTFDAITYTEAGTHVYEIAEVNGGLDGVAYDDTVHTVTINVIDDGSGRLSYTYEFGENGEPVFVNTYEKAAAPIIPTDPESGDTGDGLPRTGDMSALLVVPLMAGAGMLLAGERLRRHRDSQ